MGAKQIIKNRRNRGQLKADIANALERMVAERGFMDIPLLELIEEANMDANAFYRNCGTIDKARDEFVNRYDFWLDSLLNMSDVQTLGARKFYAEALKNIFRALQENKIMQQLLLWEASEDNETTRRTAELRETLVAGKIGYFEHIFKRTGIDINALTAWLISGVFYLVLHRERSKCCSIDFNMEEGQERFFKTIDTLVDLVFDRIEQKAKFKGIITRMQAEGMSQEKICELLDITATKLKLTVR